MKIEPFFRWYDLWIGVYIDIPNKTLYVCPVPMFGIKITCGTNEVDDKPLEPLERYAPGEPIWMYYLGQKTEGYYISTRFCGESCHIHLEGIGPVIVPIHKLNRSEYV